jgi:hypothetical protein
VQTADGGSEEAAGCRDQEGQEVEHRVAFRALTSLCSDDR